MDLKGNSRKGGCSQRYIISLYGNMRGIPFWVHLSGLLFFILKLRHVTPTVSDLTFVHWCTEKHGEFIAHPLECSKFIRCSHDRAYVFQCPTKLRWNQTIKTCDWETRTKCFLNGILEVTAASGDVKKKSVKRDTSLHAEIYASSRQPSQFSVTPDFLTVSKVFGSRTLKEAWNVSKTTTTTRVLKNSNVTESPINSNSSDIDLLTTIKSNLKTPCTKISHRRDTKSTPFSSTVNNITEYVKMAQSTKRNNIEHESSTEADYLKGSIFNSTRNSSDVLIELSTEEPNEDIITTALPLPSANDRTNNENEPLTLTEYNSLPEDTPTKEPLTVLTGQQSNENMIASELPVISEHVSSVPISVLTETATDTTITVSSTVRILEETSLTENQNGNQWKFTELANETLNDQFPTAQPEIFLNITDINTELAEVDNTGTQTEHRTESATENGNTMLTDPVVVTEQNVKVINVEFTEGDNTAIIYTNAVTESLNEVSAKTTEPAKKTGSTMLAHTVDITEQNIMGIHLKLPEGDNTVFIFTTAVTEPQSEVSAIENGSTMLAHSVNKTAQNISGIHLTLTEGDHAAMIFTTVEQETKNENYLGITRKDNSMLGDSIHITELADNLTEVPPNLSSKITKIVEDSSEIPTGITSEVMATLTTDKLTDSKPTTLLTEDSTELYTNTPDDLIEATTNMRTGKESTSTPSDTLLETSTIAVTDNTMSSVKLTGEILNENALTTLAEQATENIEFLAETSRGVTEDLTETSTNLITTINDYFTGPTKNTAMLNVRLADEDVSTTMADSIRDDIPPNLTKISTNVEDSSEIHKDVTSEVMPTLTTVRLTNSKPTTLLTEGLNELYTITADDLKAATNNLGKGTEITLPSSENVAEASTIKVTDNTMYSVKLTDGILNENAPTTSAVQSTENVEFLAETSRGVTEELTETSQYLITTIIDLFTEPTKNNIMLTVRLAEEDVNSAMLTEATLQENVMTNFNDDEAEIMNNISTVVNSGQTERPTNVKTTTSGFDTEPTTHTVTVTDPSTDESIVNDVTDAFKTQDVFTESVINAINLTETANINFEDFENTATEISETENYVLSTTTYSGADHETTEKDAFKVSSVTIPVTEKIDTSTSTMDATVTYLTDSMLDLNSNVNTMLTTTTVVSSIVITDPLTFTKTSYMEIVDLPQKQNDNEFNSDLFQERVLEVTPTVNVMLLPLRENQMSSDENVNINLISTTEITSTTAFNPPTDGGPVAISTTIDPRLPFRSPECKGDNNNRQFKASKCSQYYQCFAGWAFLLNCYDGYLFMAQEAQCIQDINRECNE